MDDTVLAKLRETIADLRARATKSQKSAAKEFGGMFKGDERKPPGDFIDSSYLYIRSCDADQGMRPLPCPVFWLSPDIRIAALSNLGTVTRELVAGHAYRLAVTLRNRGDLAVPAAKVEFFLVNPSLGFDRRWATFLGVAQTRIEAHGAAEAALDYLLPPDLAGHFCLFARVFSFAPRDLPLSDDALDPTIDRHVAQQNLTILAGASTLLVDVIHFPNADDLIQLVPMSAADLRQIRHETVSHLRPVPARFAAEFMAGVQLTFQPPKDSDIRYGTERLKDGLMMIARSDKAMSLDDRAGLIKQLGAVQAQAAKGRAVGPELRKLTQAYRQMTASMARGTLAVTLPKTGLKPDQAAGFHLRQTDRLTGRVTGGVALMVTGETG